MIAVAVVAMMTMAAQAVTETMMTHRLALVPVSVGPSLVHRPTLAVAVVAVIVTMTMMTEAALETVTTMTIVPLVGSVANSAVTPLVPIRQSKT